MIKHRTVTASHFLGCNLIAHPFRISTIRKTDKHLRLHLWFSGKYSSGEGNRCRRIRRLVVSYSGGGAKDATSGNSAAFLDGAAGVVKKRFLASPVGALNTASQLFLGAATPLERGLAAS